MQFIFLNCTLKSGLFENVGKTIYYFAAVVLLYVFQRFSKKKKKKTGIFPLVSNKMTDTLYSVMKSMIVSECFCVWHVCKVLPAKKLTHKKLINLCAPLSEVHLIITTCVEETYTLLLLLLQIQTIILKVW